VTQARRRQQEPAPLQIFLGDGPLDGLGHLPKLKRDLIWFNLRNDPRRAAPLFPRNIIVDQSAPPQIVDDILKLAACEATQKQLIVAV
jgi:hypothetical protein